MSLDDRVIVVGAGPAGLTMAAELARNGVRSRVLDRAAAPAADSRAIAIHARTLEAFASMGFVERVLAAGQRIHGANLFADGRRILHFSLDELPSPYPFALDLPQRETERILLEHLRGFGIEVERRAAVTGVSQDADGVRLHVQRAGGAVETLETEYVVGCDGANSLVRQAVGIPFEGSSAEETFLLADVAIEQDEPDDEWRFWFHEDGLLSAMPLPGGLYRLVADYDGPTPTFETLRRIFSERGPKSARLGEPAWFAPFRLSRRTAPQYQRGRVFIAGDAAHVQNPAGGQGMNTGVQDAFNLAWKLSMVLRGTAPETLLESYTAERQPVARSMLSLTANLASIATLRHPVSQGIRNRVIPILAGFEVLEHRIVERFAELSVNYRTSPIVDQHGRWTAGPLPGDRAPALYSLLRGSRHVALLFTGENPDKDDLRGFANIARYMRDGYPDEVTTHLIARRTALWDGPSIADPDGHAHHAYSAGVPCVYLVRPDGYIGFRSLTADPLPLLEHLNRVYEPPMAVDAAVS